MHAPLLVQIDAGVAAALAVIVGAAAVAKLARPAVFARNLQLLDRSLAARPGLARRLALGASVYEAAVAVGVVAFRADAGFGFACGLLVACVAFLVVLGRAVRAAVPCACFGSVGRATASGREVGRAVVMLGGAAFLVAHRAVDAGGAYGFGPWAAVALVVTGAAVGVGLRVGGLIAPAAGARPAPTAG